MKAPSVDTDYVVTAVGSRSPLKVGERVRPTGEWATDFLAGGFIVSFAVRRENGEVVTIARGPQHGAVLEVAS